MALRAAFALACFLALRSGPCPFAGRYPPGMALSEYDVDELEQIPSLQTCLASGKPSEVFWRGPDVAFTADDALAVLPRLLADAFCVRMGHPGNQEVQTALTTEVLRLIGRALHSPGRRWPSASTLLVQRPDGVTEDLRSLARNAPVNAEVSSEMARVDLLLEGTRGMVDQQLASRARVKADLGCSLERTLCLPARQLLPAATALLGVLHSGDLLEGAYAARGTPAWPRPVEVLAFPEWLQAFRSVSAPFRSLPYRRVQSSEAALGVLKCALDLLSTARASQAADVAWKARQDADRGRADL